MGGLRGGRGGGGGGGFEDNESFEAMDDARSLSDGCELFFGGGGGGGDESVGCCVVASMFPCGLVRLHGDAAAASALCSCRHAAARRKNVSAAQSAQDGVILAARCVQVVTQGVLSRADTFSRLYFRASVL